MNNEPIDYFKSQALADHGVVFEDNTDYDGDDLWFERYVTVGFESDDDGKAALTAGVATHAIAGIIQLYEHPTEDLHGYTKYVPLAESFVRSLGNKSPAVDAVAVQSDPLAGLGI